MVPFKAVPGVCSGQLEYTVLCTNRLSINGAMCTSKAWESISQAALRQELKILGARCLRCCSAHRRRFFLSTTLIGVLRSLQAT